MIHLQTAAGNTFLNILQCGNRAGNNVDTGIQPHTAHPDRLAHAGLVIDNIFLNHSVQNAVIRRDIDRFRRFDGAVDIRLTDFAIFDFNHALGIKASDMVARNSRSHTANLAISHQFGLADRVFDGLCGCIDIRYHTRLQTA